MTPANRYATAAGQSPDVLVQEYAPLVKRIASHLRERLPEGVDQDDLIQVGLIALLEAARRYSPAKGASFQTYASIRVRGAMLDEVRNTNWTPRSVYRRQRELTAAIQAVENRTGKPADAREIAAQLGISLEEYFRIVTSAAAHCVFSLDQEEEDGELPLHQIEDPVTEPSAELESDEFRYAVAQAIRALPEREALVMSLYYEEELNLKEIGGVLGVTESRVCQIHGQALARVRSETARQQGVLGPEPSLQTESDPFAKEALRMLVDGTEPEKIPETLELEPEARKSRKPRAPRPSTVLASTPRLRAPSARCPA